MREHTRAHASTREHTRAHASTREHTRAEHVHEPSRRPCLCLQEELATLWLRTNLVAYLSTGYMFEKYNCTAAGVGGGGGEYVPQKGFGWSNGVVLDLLRRLGPQL